MLRIEWDSTGISPEREKKNGMQFTSFYFRLFCVFLCVCACGCVCVCVCVWFLFIYLFF